MANGQVSIQMHTIETGARDLLRDNLDGLRQELAQMGLKSGSLDVSGGRDQGGRSFAQQFGLGDDGSGRGRDGSAGPGGDGRGAGTGHGTYRDEAEAAPRTPTLTRDPASGQPALDVQI